MVPCTEKTRTSKWTAVSGFSCTILVMTSSMARLKRMTCRGSMWFSRQKPAILPLASQICAVSPATEKFATCPPSSRDRSISRYRVRSGCRLRKRETARAHRARVTASLRIRNHQGLRPSASAAQRLTAAARNTRQVMMALAQPTWPEML